jgi:glycosyltransferase involved in cell wall biosynthesis
MMKLAQVYPHSVISVPRADVYDALAIVNYEIGRRLAQSNSVVTYPKWVKGQRKIEQHEGVTYRRVPERIDSALNLLRVLDNRLLRPDRPFRLSSLYYARYASKVARDIRERGCDAVHIHSVPNFIPVVRKLNPKARIALHMHDHSLADFDARIVGPRLEQANLIVACSDFVINAIRNRFPQLAGRCHTLYNGVDERFLNIQADPARSQTVLFVGRLCPEKGVHLLLEAMKSMPAPGTLSLVGPLDVAPREFVDPLSADALFEDLRGFYRHPQGFRDLLLREAGAPGAIGISAPTTRKPACSCFLRSGMSRSAFRSSRRWPPDYPSWPLAAVRYRRSSSRARQGSWLNGATCGGSGRPSASCSGIRR